MAMTWHYQPVQGGVQITAFFTKGAKDVEIGWTITTKEAREQVLALCAAAGLPEPWASR